MLDFDKWPASLQWLIGLGVFLGGIIASWYGVVVSKTRPPEYAPQVREDERQRIEQARIAERERVELQAKVNEDRIRRDFELAIAAARQSFDDELQRIDERLRKAETSVEVLKSNRRQRPD